LGVAFDRAEGLAERDAARDEFRHRVAELFREGGHELLARASILEADPDDPASLNRVEEVGRLGELLHTHPYVPKRVEALRLFAQSNVYLRAVGQGGGLTKTEGDERVADLVRVIGGPKRAPGAPAGKPTTPAPVVTASAEGDESKKSAGNGGWTGQGGGEDADDDHQTEPDDAG
jgi:hypothetical protein